MDDGWDPQSSTWEGVVERDPGLSTAVRVLLAVMLFGGIAIGVGVARITDSDSQAAGADDDRSANVANTADASTAAEPSAEESVAAVSGDSAAASGASSSDTARPDVVIADPLSSLATAPIADLWPVALVEIDGTHVLYGTGDVPFGTDSGSGLQAWTSDDGTAWSSLGTVIAAPAAVHRVVATPQGLFAVGGLRADSPTLFRSDDGRSWRSVGLPAVDSEGAPSFPSAVAANDQTIVIVGAGAFAPFHDALTQAIPERFRPSAENGFGIGTSSPPFTVQVHGPLGIVIFSATGEELGLDDDAMDAHMGLPGGMSTTVWTSSDGATWTTSTIEDVQIQTVTSTDDGEFIAFGFGFRGEQVLTSSDGIAWEDTRSNQRIQMRVSGLAGWLGASQDIRPGLQFSVDGETWERIDLGEALDRAFQWNFHGLASGEGGFAAIANGYDESQMMNEPEPVVIDKNGFVLTHDMMRGSLTIADATGGEVFRAFTHSNRADDHIVVDVDALTVTFLDETGEAILDFTLAELQAAQEASYQAFRPDGMRQVLLASPDGTTWSVTELAAGGSGNASFHSIQVEEDSILAVITEFEPETSHLQSPPSVSMQTFAFP